MSVIIKGMKMPESCQKCNISVKFCDLWLKLTIEDKCKLRHPDCPICELPEKHGDLIDRDELKKHKEYNIERHENVVSVACIDWMMPLVEKENEHENSI